jgi:D-sedoheptulose 7-phosphate isomerase
MEDGRVEVERLATGYLQDLDALMQSMDMHALERVVERFRAVRDRGGAIYIAGNGGSAATATHWVNDLGKATKASGRPWLRVLCLSDNVSWLTALGNDEGYERVFSGQLENFARPGDLLAVISASGNSPNLLRAVELAATKGVETVALLGFDGGALRDMVDEPLWLKTEIGAYGLVESAHSIVCDIVTCCLIRDGADASRGCRCLSRQPGSRGTLAGRPRR